MTKLIQVGNLSDSVDNLSLLRLFQVHGIVRSAIVSTNPETGRSTGMGFIEMESEESGAAAIAALNNQEHVGRVLSVYWNEGLEGQVANRRQMFGPMSMPGVRTRKEESD
jgi:RNA recognition motif-containing protein